MTFFNCVQYRLLSILLNWQIHNNPFSSPVTKPSRKRYKFTQCTLYGSTPTTYLHQKKCHHNAKKLFQSSHPSVKKKPGAIQLSTRPHTSQTVRHTSSYKPNSWVHIRPHTSQTVVYTNSHEPDSCVHVLMQAKQLGTHTSSYQPDSCVHELTLAIQLCKRTHTSLTFEYTYSY
jgi:hypothetical protein